MRQFGPATSSSHFVIATLSDKARATLILSATYGSLLHVKLRVQKFQGGIGGWDDGMSFCTACWLADTCRAAVAFRFPLAVPYAVYRPCLRQLPNPEREIGKGKKRDEGGGALN